MAGLIALLGVALILCVVAFPTRTTYLLVKWQFYQKLWLGRMTVVLLCVVCLFFA